MERTGTAAIDAERLRQLVADSLGVDPSALEGHVPLSRYGLDSLGAVELAARIGEALEREVPPWLDPGDATLEGLSELLRRRTPPSQDTLRARLSGDAILSASIRPERAHSLSIAPERVLLTGATGFLGVHLLVELLARSPAHVVCPVRAKSPAEGRARVARALARYALPDVMASARIEVVTADLAKPRLGLSSSAWARLAGTVDSIHHAAALVNWVAPYDALRDVNVEGTRALIELACRGPAKPLHFVSSLAVCYAVGGPPRVSEADDMLGHAPNLPLGYAQSKCVAEALVREAGRRGLPVTIVRPSLISGAQRSGISNPDDLLSALLKGCIEMKAAPDLDWLVDCVPVDGVADALVRLASAAIPGSPRVFHLSSPRPRSWRECVLWLNLSGYDVRLVGYPEWLGQLDVSVRSPGHALRPLRGFFLGRPPMAGGLTLPELYEEGRRSRADGGLTRATLARLGGGLVAVDPGLLDRYLASDLARGFLPPAPRRPVHPAEAGSVAPTPAFFERLLREGGDRDSIRVTGVTARARDTDHSILGELSARGGIETGLWRYRLDVTTAAGRSRRDVVVKAKARDDVVLAVGDRLAHLVDPQLGREYTRFQRWLGVTGSHVRELAIYGETDPRFRRHVPAVLGTLRDDARRIWVLVLEDLTGARLLDSVNDPQPWRAEDIEAAVRGIAEVHAIWYGREPELRSRPWLGPVLSAEAMVELRPLWRALADHAAPFFGEWGGRDLPRRHRALVEGLEDWWRPLEVLPRTLIHNDFNPRNLALRGTPAAPTLCAYDWELATLGVPQRDLAELFCFVLGRAPSRTDVAQFVEIHRATLEAAVGRPVESAVSWLGLRLSLLDLLVTRLPMYALANRIRPQRFLPRVVQAWHALDHLLADTSA